MPPTEDPIASSPASALPRLCAIVDADVAARAGMAVPDLARAYLDGGARFLQLRAKSTPSGQLLEWTEALAALARDAGARLVINDRFDLALLAGVTGLHVGQEDLPVPIVRRWLGAEAFIGLSTHTAEQIDDALRQPISYLAIGPVYGTTTKATGYHAIGLERVRLAARRAADAAAAVGGEPLPVVAIGGITLDNAQAVIDAGASSVAVIGDLLMTGDPVARAAQFVQRLGR